MNKESWRKKTPYDKRIEKSHYGYPAQIKKDIAIFSDRKYRILPNGSWQRLS